MIPNGWGGWRKGSGPRKRKSGVAHVTRPRVKKSDVMHLTWKLRKELPSLRNSSAARAILDALRKAKLAGLRVIHFSIQNHHIHMIVEAPNRELLANCMRGLGCRIAKALNKAWNRTGKVFAERFHQVLLEGFQQVRNALRYVLNNHLKHKQKSEAGRPDSYSSDGYFDGWSDFKRLRDPDGKNSVVSTGGWRFAQGWKRRCAPFSLRHVRG
ncbi:MAG: REP element-mobilizing transposase RayT [Planctomycetota bacterium]|jgi:REP element-mobilizing transposase RayT